LSSQQIWKWYSWSAFVACIQQAQRWQFCFPSLRRATNNNSCLNTQNNYNFQSLSYILASSSSKVAHPHIYVRSIKMDVKRTPIYRPQGFPDLSLATWKERK
jgi:hypothetical protein